jgi:hypothetical protein
LVIYQGRSSRRAAQVMRSQLAVRLGLGIYSLVCAAIALRCAVLIFSLPDTVWSVRFILSASSPMVSPLRIIPAGSRVVLGEATLSDLTAAVVLLALPLPLLGLRGRVP